MATTSSVRTAASAVDSLRFLIEGLHVFHEDAFLSANCWKNMRIFDSDGTIDFRRFIRPITDPITVIRGSGKPVLSHNRSKRLRDDNRQRKAA